MLWIKLPKAGAGQHVERDAPKNKKIRVPLEAKENFLVIQRAGRGKPPTPPKAGG